MQEKKGLLDGLFPPRYDFNTVLAEQADSTARGVELLLASLKGETDNLEPLEDLDQRTDGLRYEMERNLEAVFSTPFDRQDIYSMSRQMDMILNFARTTLMEMRAFDVEPDRCMIDMTEHLLIGSREVVLAVKDLGMEKNRTDELIKVMREQEALMEEIYIAGMKDVFLLPDHIIMLKKREIYHHLKDAGRALSTTADILHRTAFGIG
ncbi:MAG: DUF47 family protein [Methanomassiliicoccales archaeon]|nr:DUF47 family protein [Methanomassiliicoccales archaeon]